MILEQELNIYIGVSVICHFCFNILLCQMFLESLPTPRRNIFLCQKFLESLLTPRRIERSQFRVDLKCSTLRISVPINLVLCFGECNILASGLIILNWDHHKSVIRLIQGSKNFAPICINWQNPLKITKKHSRNRFNGKAFISVMPDRMALTVCHCGFSFRDIRSGSYPGRTIFR